MSKKNRFNNPKLEEWDRYTKPLKEGEGKKSQKKKNRTGRGKSLKNNKLW